MAIHAKKNGLLISVLILDVTDKYWHIHAVDEKRPKFISKSDPKNKVFDGNSALDDALAWQKQNR